MFCGGVGGLVVGAGPAPPPPPALLFWLTLPRLPYWPAFRLAPPLGPY